MPSHSKSRIAEIGFVPKPNSEDFVKAYEVDSGYRLAYEAWTSLAASELEIVIHSRYSPDLTISQLGSPEEGCFLLQRENRKAAKIVDIEKVRRLIALEIGMTPAAFQIEIPSHYDTEILRKYRYSFEAGVTCFRRGCIRPSHIRVCTYYGSPTRYPLVRPVGI